MGNLVDINRRFIICVLRKLANTNLLVPNDFGLMDLDPDKCVTYLN